MSAKNKIDVNVGGCKFTLVGSEDTAYTKQIAAYVDDKINKVTRNNNRIAGTMAAALAAINITDELYKTREELESFKTKAKDPMEKYSALRDELLEISRVNENLDKINREQEAQIAALKEENEKFNYKLKNGESILELKEREIEEKEAMIVKLQEKIFESQIELVDTKKELEELKRTYGKKDLDKLGEEVKISEK